MDENPIIGKAYNIVEEVVTMLGREIIAQDREIKALTTERDNARKDLERALLRVEELERDVEYWRDIARSSLWVDPSV